MRRRRDHDAPPPRAGPAPADWHSREYDALLAALRRAVRGTGLTLATHQNLAELRVSRGEHRVTVWLLTEGSVMIVARTTSQVAMSYQGPRDADDMEPWARKLAEFITRRLQQ